MPEILASLLPAAAEIGADAAVGSAADIASGVGSAAIGGGADILSTAATGLASGVGTAADAASSVGGSVTGGGGAGLDLGGLTDAALPANSILTSGSGNPVPFGGVTSTGPGAGVTAADAGGLVSSGPVSAASAAAPAGTGSLDLTSLLGKAGDKIMDNPLGLALAGGGLGYSIFKGQQDSAATKAIADQAGDVKKLATDITGQGQTLAGYTSSGTLPPAIQQQLDNQIKDAKTKMISTYAAQGMNTDPAKNSVLRQELEAIDKQGTALKGDLEKQLLASGATLINSGTALVGADNDLLKTLSNIDQQQTARIGQAIANFATALSGKSPGLTLNLNK